MLRVLNFIEAILERGTHIEHDRRFRELHRFLRFGDDLLEITLTGFTIFAGSTVQPIITRRVRPPTTSFESHRRE